MKIHILRTRPNAPRPFVPPLAAIVSCLIFASVAAYTSPASSEELTSADWPMWRHDAARSGISPAALSEQLYLRWIRELPQPAPAWSAERQGVEPRRSYEPVVMGQQIFVASMVQDKIAAYDTETGRQNWQFFSDGPIRFAPIAWRGHVYFVSDDGGLYCLDAQNGHLLWKVPLAPGKRKLLGNGRLISAWPASGGPVLHDGTIYCAAGIWPFMGIFVYAINAETGDVIWENSGTGTIDVGLQHSHRAFAEAGPQGYLAVADGEVFAAGRTASACFDTETGRLAQAAREAPDSRGLWPGRSVPPLDRIHLRAGDRLYGSNDDGLIAAIAADNGPQEPRIVWSTQIQGRESNMLAGDGKLFVVTEEGLLYCFGPMKRYPRSHRNQVDQPIPANPADHDRAGQILAQCADARGYALWLGGTRGSLLQEIVRQSEMHVIVVDPNADRVASLRAELDRTGLYGSRVHVLAGNLDTMELSPYWASLIIVANLDGTALSSNQTAIERMYDLLRPYTGIAWLEADKRQQLALYRQLANTHLPGCHIDDFARALVLRRAGAIPGSADWTHQYGDIANTACSNDQLRGPLGLLWFGQEHALDNVPPRHAPGLPEQVAAGRLLIEGTDSLVARDVYTGRTLWQRTLKGLDHFVATTDRVYTVQEAECHVLDAKTGRPQHILQLPDTVGSPIDNWGYIGVYNDYLIAAAGSLRPSLTTDRSDENAAKRAPVSSRKLLVMNRHTGRVIWTLTAQQGFLHDAIVAGQDKIFCLDTLPPDFRKEAESQGLTSPFKNRLMALDIHTGQAVWTDETRTFGSWLSFSESFGVLLEAHRPSPDGPREPGNRMAVFHAETGAVIWDKPISHYGPCILRGGTIITQDAAYSLLTGRPQMRRHPLSGEPVPWRYSRNGGTAIGSRNLLTFRSAAAGYIDLVNDDGSTGHLGGFSSSGTANLVVANGVLNALAYPHTCPRSDQIQTSLAMVHMPDMEIWTTNDIEPSTAPIQRVGINFGAPGDRKADDGTFWLGYPCVGGMPSALDIALTPQDPIWFRQHSLRLADGSLKWVEASGAKGLLSIRICLSGSRSIALPSPEASLYAIRLHFAEPDAVPPGQRQFDVAINEKTVLTDFDIADEAQAPNVGIVKEFKHIRTSNDIIISLTPAGASDETVICGIEIIAETEKTH